MTQERFSTVIRKTLRSATSFGEFLTFEYSDRRKRNLSYSYRAFARDLGMVPSHLSEVLKGKTGVSMRILNRLQDRLKLSTGELEYLNVLIDRDHARSPAVRAAATAKSDVYRKLLGSTEIDADQLLQMKDWYYFVLIEVGRTDLINQPAKKLAEQLGIAERELDQALEDLLRMGHLIQRNGKIEATNDVAIPDSQIPSEVIRNYHREFMERARSSIDNQALSQRFLSTNLNAVSRADYARAVAAIDKFADEFNREFGRPSEGETVYGLAMQFFEITPPRE